MEHKKTGLILFGILWILVGLVTASMAFFVVVAVVAGSGMPGAPPMRMMAPAALMYLVIGACFVTLGIGSIMAKRWARSLVLALSWMWLLIGVLAAISLFLVVPKMFSTLPPDQAAAKPVIIGCMAVMIVLFFILLPGAAILFYRRPAVQATVEALDPVPRWTDQPLPLLAFAVWMIGGAACFLPYAFMYTSLPLGTLVLRGAPVYVLVFAMAALMFYIGFGALKRKPAAWWAAIGLFALGAVFGTLMLTKADLAAWSREMSVGDPRQTEAMMELYKSPFFVVWIVVFWGAYLGFLLYLRRYFFGAPPRPQNGDLMNPPST